MAFEEALHQKQSYYHLLAEAPYQQSPFYTEKDFEEPQINVESPYYYYPHLNHYPHAHAHAHAHAHPHAHPHAPPPQMLYKEIYNPENLFVNGKYGTASSTSPPVPPPAAPPAPLLPVVATALDDYAEGVPKEDYNDEPYDFIDNDEHSTSSSMLDDCNVFVKYLPSDLSDSDFYKMFKSFGNIISSKIMVDQGTGKSLGYGFVRYSNSAASQKAIHHMNGHRIANKRLLCKLANLSPSSFNSEFSKNPLLNSQTPNDNIYIKPLHKDTSEEDLRKLFGKFGNIIDCKVMIDRNTGVSRQIGFVRFQTQQQALNAIHNMNNFKLYPSAPPLTVKFADTKEQKNARKALRQKQTKPFDEGSHSPLASPVIPLSPSSSLLPPSHPLPLPLSLPLPIPVLPVPSSSSFYYPSSASGSLSSSPQSPTGTEYYFPSPPTQAYFPLPSMVGVPQEQEEPLYFPPAPGTAPSTTTQPYPYIDVYYNPGVFPQSELLGYSNFVDSAGGINQVETKDLAAPRNPVKITPHNPPPPSVLYGDPAYVEAYPREEGIEKVYLGDLIYYPYLESDHYYNTYKNASPSAPEEFVAPSPFHPSLAEYDEEVHASPRK